MSIQFWETNLIFKVVCGSRAYGLDNAESDLDTRGVCVPPKNYLLGLSKFEQHVSDGSDHVVYGLEKFVRLALEGNPNIIETLFTDPADIIFIDRFGERLINRRDGLLSRQVGERFMGYALGQQKRMKRHFRWLSDPEPEEPTPSEYGAQQASGRTKWPSGEAQAEYRVGHKKWSEYQTWKSNRNPKRAALEAAFGYDTKHAQHICRLLTMGEEILRDGTVSVKRDDAEFLRSVRDGALGYNELMDWINEHLALIPSLVGGSPLPDRPDQSGWENLVVEIQEEFLFAR